jgi:phytoene dehydrogenase-like protein
MSNKRMIVIGGGIAGLCAGVYARRCGYEVEVLERGHSAGGLATSWPRGDYRFETCLHWLLGSNPNDAMYSRWKEVFEIDRLRFLDPEEFVRQESASGESLTIYTDVDRMERELLERAPEDAEEIARFAAAVRKLARLPMPDPDAPLSTALHALPAIPLLYELSHISSEDYGKRFRHPLLRSFFDGGSTARMSVLALVFSLAWMNNRNAGYAIGGSQAIIRLLVENFQALGGRLRLEAAVEKILVENDAAVGVELASGETIRADWVMSAADGYTTIYRMLGGSYKDDATDKAYRTMETFPSYLQVSLGVRRDLSKEPRFVTRLLSEPLRVDPATSLGALSFRIFHFDPTFAPAGATAVTSFVPTRNYEYWTRLAGQSDRTEYEAEKKRVAEAVIEVLEGRIPGIREAIEVVDVSTPATVLRFTGNWKGSMEGWLPTPETGFRMLRKRLPGLRRFLMAGQWVMPGGGLPSGLMTARSAIRAACKEDRMPFLPATLPRAA